MSVDLSNRDLTELRISPEGKLVLVSPSGDDSTEYVWAEITDLNCSGKVRRRLPPLPEGLSWLCCPNNQLKALPPLPEGLKWLHCDNNQLKTLPSLPEGLKVLYCDNNPFGKGCVEIISPSS